MWGFAPYLCLRLLTPDYRGVIFPVDLIWKIMIDFMFVSYFCSAALSPPEGRHTTRPFIVFLSIQIIWKSCAEIPNDCEVTCSCRLLDLTKTMWEQTDAAAGSEHGSPSYSHPTFMLFRCSSVRFVSSYEVKTSTVSVTKQHLMCLYYWVKEQFNKIYICSPPLLLLRI